MRESSQGHCFRQEERNKDTDPVRQRGTERRKKYKTKMFLSSSAVAREGLTREGMVKAMHPAGRCMVPLTLFGILAHGDHCNGVACLQTVYHLTACTRWAACSVPPVLSSVCASWGSE